MKYVKLGNSGVDVSRICLGMMSFGKPGTENGVFPWAMEFEDAKPLFRKAVELGINFSTPPTFTSSAAVKSSPAS